MTHGGGSGLTKVSGDIYLKKITSKSLEKAIMLLVKLKNVVSQWRGEGYGKISPNVSWRRKVV